MPTLLTPTPKASEPPSFKGKSLEFHIYGMASWYTTRWCVKIVQENSKREMRKMTTNFRNQLQKTKPKTSLINNTKNTRTIVVIFFKCSPELCPREFRMAMCCPADTLFHKGGYANSSYLTTLPTLPYVWSVSFWVGTCLVTWSILDRVTMPCPELISWQGRHLRRSKKWCDMSDSSDRRGRPCSRGHQRKNYIFHGDGFSVIFFLIKYVYTKMKMTIVFSSLRRFGKCIFWPWEVNLKIWSQFRPGQGQVYALVPMHPSRSICIRVGRKNES